MMKKLIFILLCMTMPVLPAQASESAIEQLQDGYRVAGATEFSAARGKSMWSRSFMQEKLGKQVKCASCHTTNLSQAGSHLRTGKIIEPMAVSANALRFNDPEKIEKWFLRNCKWTLGRECSVQEKGDFLSYFQGE